MNTIKSFLFSLVAIPSLFISGPVFAVDSKPMTEIKLDASNVVADVNVENPKIISQKGGLFKISFTLTNGAGIQTGVKYGIQLVADGGKYLIDEKVYEESLTLYENSKVEKEIIYVAPSVLSGSYTMYLVSKNESNFPFTVITLGKIKLTASAKGIEILNSSCYTQVEGEKGSPKYGTTLAEGSVDISMSEELKLTCTAVNHATTSMTVIPYYETHYISAYGKVAQQEGGDYKSITFAKGEKKNFSVILPKSNTAQSYNIRFGLLSSDTSSNLVSIGYIIRGVSGTIQKISLDKNYYKIGEKGEMTVLWYASNGNFFSRSTNKSGELPKVTLSATITNEKGGECASPIKEALVRDPKDAFSRIEFNTKSKCMNPKVKATLSDETGKVLDEKEFAFKSDPTSEEVIAYNTKKSMNPQTALILVVVLLAIVGAGIYMKKKKGVNI